MPPDTSGVEIPFETLHEVSRKARSAAIDALTMEWAADVARRDQELAQVTAERDMLLTRIGELEDQLADEGTDDGDADA